MFLSLIVPGPDYPGKNLSVYMQPLIDELKEAWENGFRTYDRSSKRHFDMYVWFQYSMHELPAFGLFIQGMEVEYDGDDVEEEVEDLEDLSYLEAYHLVKLDSAKKVKPFDPALPSSSFGDSIGKRKTVYDHEFKKKKRGGR